MSDTVQDFRNRYHQSTSPRYVGWAHFAFTFGASSALIMLAIRSLESVTTVECLTIPLTFIYANLAEYFGHRGPMHHPRPGLGIIYQRHTKQHHRFFTHENMAFDSSRDFKAVLFPPVLILFFLVGAGGPVALLLAWLITPNVGLLFAITGLAYFLNYELLHFIYHCKDDSAWRRIPGVNRLRRLHLNHHDPRLMQQRNFNITYPIGDWLFGTLHRPHADKGDH